MSLGGTGGDELYLNAGAWRQLAAAKSSPKEEDLFEDCLRDQEYRHCQQIGKCCLEEKLS